jgi:hypothetical protein
MTTSHYNSTLWKSMITIAFFGLMRISEITIYATNQIALDIKQIIITPDFVNIKISKFKHNKNGQEKYTLLTKQY